MAVMVDGRIGRQIEGFNSGAFSLVVEMKRGDGAHVKQAFAKGKAAGLFKDGDQVICINTTRNSDRVKQFMVRILFVTSGDPVLGSTHSAVAEEPAMESKPKRARTS